MNVNEKINNWKRLTLYIKRSYSKPGLIFSGAIVLFLLYIPCFYLWKILSGDLMYEIYDSQVVVGTRSYTDALTTTLFGFGFFALIAIAGLFLIYKFLWRDYNYSRDYVKNWKELLPAINREQLGESAKEFVKSHEEGLLKHEGWLH